MQSFGGARALFLRAGLPLTIFAALLLLPGATDDYALAAVVPWFVVLMILQLAPAMLSARVDLFAPPVSAGLIGAFGSFSALVGFFRLGGLRFETLRSVDPSEVSELLIKTLIVLIIGTVTYLVGYYSPVGRSF